MSVSVLILTLNEEANLPGCLESVAWCDDVVVFDSFSTDRTEQIAREAGARFVQREFDNYSAHRNWALRNIDFRFDWVFSLDADERFTPELRDEILSVTSADGADGFAAYRVRYKNFLNARRLRRATLYPTWLLRLFRPGRVTYEDRSVNAHPHVDGRVGALQAHFEHHSFNRGLEHWFHKHNLYSSMEARVCLRELAHGRLDWRGLFSRDPVRRRRALKDLSFRLPGRPWLKFFYMYLFRGGFLDGTPGLTYCTLQAIYEYMICLKIKELKRRANGLPR